MSYSKDHSKKDDAIVSLLHQCNVTTKQDHRDIAEKKEGIKLKDITNDDGPILMLNDDCLIHIFTFLPTYERIRIQRVCKRFQEVSKMPWCDKKKLSVVVPSSDATRPLNIEYTMPILKQILSFCGRNLTDIEFKKSPGQPRLKEMLTLVSKVCKNLKSLRLCKYDLELEVSECLRVKYSHITHFALVRCKMCTDYGLSRFFSNNKKLQSLEICLSSVLNGSCLLNLNPDTITSISIKYLFQLRSQHLVNALKKFRNLESFSLDACNLVSYEYEDFLKAIPVPSNLRTLHLQTFYSPLRDIFNHHIESVSKFINLQTLELSFGPLLHNRTLYLIGKNCKELTRVSLRRSSTVTDEGVKYILSLPKLECLSLNNIEYITDNLFEYMMKLKSLTCLRCRRLSNRGFSNFLLESENLEFLEVKECKRVYNTILVESAKEMAKRRINNARFTLSIQSHSLLMKMVTLVSPRLYIVRVPCY